MDSLEKELEQLRKKVDHYEKVLGIGAYNPSTEAFSVLVAQLKQRVDYIKGFKISERISDVAKDNPLYARATELIDGLPKMISQVNALSLELKIEYTPENDVEKKGATSPQNLITKV
jgi:hypothetical protein